MSATTAERKHTPGPWECQRGHSDWGMPCAHIIVPAGETGNDSETWIAEIPSITPYCIGASRKDIARAQSQAANARLIAAAPTMYEALDPFADIVSEGCDDLPDETLAVVKIGGRVVDFTLTLADFRRAVAALAAAEGRP